jgi:Zn-dependent protease with chaperone function
MDKQMSDMLYNELFKDYYLSNRGKKYKSFSIAINRYHYKYDIYWGDPNIIFDKATINVLLPLAVTVIPHRFNYPNPRIFLHEKLEVKNDAFEVVVAHEIGHLWLHDIIGINNPSTTNCMNESDSEKWADYFHTFF